MQVTDVDVRDVEQAGGVATDGVELTVYRVIGEPPVTVGSVQVMVADVERFATGAAVTPVGGAAVPAVIELDGADAALVPAALVAVTVNV